MNSHTVFSTNFLISNPLMSFHKQNLNHLNTITCCIFHNATPITNFVCHVGNIMKSTPNVYLILFSILIVASIECAVFQRPTNLHHYTTSDSCKIILLNFAQFESFSSRPVIPSESQSNELYHIRADTISIFTRNRQLHRQLLD